MAEEDKGERREVGHYSVKNQNFFTSTVSFNKKQYPFKSWAADNGLGHG